MLLSHPTKNLVYSIFDRMENLEAVPSSYCNEKLRSVDRQG